MTKKQNIIIYNNKIHLLHWAKSHFNFELIANPQLHFSVLFAQEKTEFKTPAGPEKEIYFVVKRDTRSFVALSGKFRM